MLRLTRAPRPLLASGARAGGVVFSACGAAPCVHPPLVARGHGDHLFLFADRGFGLHDSLGFWVRILPVLPVCWTHSALGWRPGVSPQTGYCISTLLVASRASAHLATPALGGFEAGEMSEGHLQPSNIDFSRPFAGPAAVSRFCLHWLCLPPGHGAVLGARALVGVMVSDLYLVYGGVRRYRSGVQPVGCHIWSVCKSVARFVARPA